MRPDVIVRRIEDQKVETKVTKVDPLKEPQIGSSENILGVAIPKKADSNNAIYGAKVVKDGDFKFAIAITKSGR